MHKNDYLICIMAALLLAACTRTPAAPPPSASRTVTITEYPSLDWSLNGQRLEEASCASEPDRLCPQARALACDELNGPSFYLGGLQPPYPVLECIHAGADNPDPAYFRQPAGLDTRLRSLVVVRDGQFQLLIRRAEFQALFAPVQSPDEALSYALAMTGLAARYDLDPAAQVDYLVKEIAETHVEETPEGYLVYLFASDGQMGCADHSFYAVQVLVTPAGDVREAARQEIYRSYACFDFAALALEE